jgi:hypothetical protein
MTVRLVLVAATIVPFASVAASRAAAATPRACAGAVTAAGRQYVVHVDGVSCAMAKSWTARLAGKRLPPHSVEAKLAGGPRGFTCSGTTSQGFVSTSVPATAQVAGTCTRGGLVPSFDWIVKARG